MMLALRVYVGRGDGHIKFDTIVPSGMGLRFAGQQIPGLTGSGTLIDFEGVPTQRSRMPAGVLFRIPGS